MLNETGDCEGKMLANDNLLTTDGIDFIVDPSQRYFTSRYLRLITDENIVPDYRAFFESDLWKPGMNEFVDASVPSVLKLGEKGLYEVASFAMEILTKHQIDDYHSAIYAPHPLPHGLARMYQAIADENSETTRIFADYDEALDWLLANSPGPRA
ncbi:hypothetical protein [Sneathiella glossodoripedis]|uniref:hypothetical protein n=1 Tax=Sneathiella glossodoripedis TaxID=418853 RepID=UPI000472BD41|nr:hypothetical protein [Sneathiella glossodoripedis]